jgi:hypothetical protein
MYLHKDGFPRARASQVAWLFAAPMAIGACILVSVPATNPAFCAANSVRPDQRRLSAKTLDV